MEPFEWVVVGMLAYAIFPKVRKAVSTTWSSITSTANQTVQGIGRTTSNAVNQAQHMFASPEQQ
ncbi:hypothetical protein DNHGIG_18610 [Collibacillus ludicampi]|uniref:Uncharacterized protein n=1 Tax=Collibacillus ludicampi TaxID=2771369 RepID=A0AAV4LEP8_9BACL|nr:hypothetical protein [Collibacillus ludicampi]GIM46312.1 hypothetical protein DNHGIG_18610 [Collibacillus ludicampi]